MVRIGALAGGLAVGALLAGAAFPQASQPENEESRFSFFRDSDGFLRLDAVSGQVSLCTRREAGWLCQASPEERAALEAEIARLQAENAALKKEVLSHGLPLPGGVRSNAPPGASSQLSTDHEAKEIMSIINNVWRRLVAMIASVQRDLLEKS